MKFYSNALRAVTGDQTIGSDTVCFTHQIAAEPNNAATGTLTINGKPLGLTGYQLLGVIDLTAPVVLIAEGWFTEFEIVASVGTDDYDLIVGG